MTEIRLHRHPLKGRQAEVHHASSVGAWLLAHYGERAAVAHQVYAGEPAQETEVTANVPALLRNDAPYYTVLETPGGPLIPILVNMAISFVLSMVVKSIFEPDKAKLDNRGQESPNNALTNRENRVRPLERVEDIFGTVRSVPSLLMPTYFKWQENRRVEYALMCIGRGYYDTDDIREGDTLLSSVTGASAAIYWPFTSPNSGTPVLEIGDAIVDPVLRVTRSSGVDGVVLKASNQIQIQAGLGFYLIGPGYPGSGDDIPANTSAYDMVWQPLGQRRPNFAAVAEIGQTLTIAMDAATTRRVIDSPPHWTQVITATRTIEVDPGSAGFWTGAVVGEPIVVSGLNPATVDGTYTIESYNDTQLVVEEPIGAGEDLLAVMAGTFDITVGYGGERTINEVGDGTVWLDGPSQFSPIVPTPVGGDFLGAPEATINIGNSLSDWTDWVTLPDPQRTEVWTNTVARGGMYKDDGSKNGTTVEYEVQIERLTSLLVPTGDLDTYGSSISGATSNVRAETLERVSMTGPVRVRMRRTTPFDYSFAGSVVDEITWEDLYGVVPVDKANFGNKTIIHTVTRATPGATAVRRRELNCLASRLLPIYNGSTFSGGFNDDGSLGSGTIAATSRIVDILAAVTRDPRIGNRAITDLDLAQVWGVQQELDAWNMECGQFNYTFDSDGTSYEETMLAIADAAFCRPYRQNGQIRLALNRPQAASVALFTHRNKKPDSETVSRRFANDSDYDGVEFIYMDPATETQETIRLPTDGSALKSKRIEIPGIRSFEQAWFRASREYNRLQYERLSLETITTTDARALLPNSRIDVADNTTFRTFDGEVVGQDGLTLTLSRPVEFLPAEPHSIVLTKRDGSIQSIAVTEGAAPNEVFLAAAPDEALVVTSTPEEGVRTMFSLAADIARDAQQWLVQTLSLDDDGRYVRVRAVNYAPEYYAADAEAVPDKDSVLND